jgi:chromosome segregation ATPase
MRKGAKGMVAAGKELDELAKDLPRLRQALEESRKVSAKTREALGKAIKEQEQLEGLLKSIPGHTARLAQELPALTSDLSKVLRETAQLKEVAAALRQTEKGMEKAVEKWPGLRKGLRESAAVLRMTQTQLDKTLASQAKHRAVLDRTLDLADVLAKLLPLYLDQLERHLIEQEQSLASLGESLDEVRATIPVWGETTRRVVLLLRVGLWTFAGIFLLLGGYACSIGLRRTVVVPVAVVPLLPGEPGESVAGGSGIITPTGG